MRPACLLLLALGAAPAGGPPGPPPTPWGKAMYLRGEDFLYRIEERTASP